MLTSDVIDRYAGEVNKFMKWWQRLQKNPLAKLGAGILILFYIMAIAADFVAPYNPYNSQLDGSLLPPTPIHWVNPQGEFIGLHVYPTTQGPVDIETGQRQTIVDWEQPSPLRLFVKGDPYKILGLIPFDLHLFGVVGPAYINLIGTDEQARDQLSRLVFGSRISLSIGLVGIAIAFPLGMLVGGISGYFGGWIDTISMRLVEVLMTIPGDRKSVV